MGTDGEIVRLIDGSVWEVKFEYQYLYAYNARVAVCPDKGTLVIGDKTLRVERVRSAAVRPREQQAPAQSSQPARTAAPRSGSAYVSKIETESDDIVRLVNGAIVEVTSGSLGSVGIRRDSVLLLLGSSCRLWIERKRTFRCSVLRAPSTGPFENHLSKKRRDCIDRGCVPGAKAQCPS